MTSLRLLGGRTIEERLVQEYPSAGYVTVLLKLATKVTFAITSNEVAGAPFEAYTLSCSAFDAETEADRRTSFSWRSMRPNTLVDRGDSVFEYDLGRTIGLDLNGNATSVRAAFDSAGKLKSAYPIPK